MSKSPQDLWKRYAALLQKSVAADVDGAGNLTDGLTKTDAEKLTTLMRQLGVSAEQAWADRRVVAEACALQADFDSCMESVQKTREAEEALKQFDQETAAKRRELQAAADDARHDSHRRGSFAQSLSSLGNRRPELFDDGDPPRLKGE